jgi:hypothetical protein
MGTDKILKEIPYPGRLLYWRERRCNSKGHLEAKSTEVVPHSLFVVVELAISVRTEMEVTDASRLALVRADPVDQVWTTERCT